MQSGSALATLRELSARSSEALLRLATRRPIEGRRRPPRPTWPLFRSPLSKSTASALARARDTAAPALLPPSNSKSVRPVCLQPLPASIYACFIADFSAVERTPGAAGITERSKHSMLHGCIERGDAHPLTRPPLHARVLPSNKVVRLRKFHLLKIMP